MKSLFVAVLLLAVCFSTSSALRCYSCVNCPSVSGIAGQECSPALATGFKYGCMKVTAQVDGSTMTVRSCVAVLGDSDPCSLTNDLERCSVCYTDLCNSATNGATTGSPNATTNDSASVMISSWTIMGLVTVTLFRKIY